MLPQPKWCPLMSEGCEKSSALGEEEADTEYKQGLLKRGVVCPALQCSSCAMLTATPTCAREKLSEEAHLHAACPQHPALPVPSVREAGAL